jgi:hypothetical protein
MKLYKLLPFEDLLIKSILTQEDAVKKLANVVEPMRGFRFLNSSSKPYEGEIQGYKFKMMRVIRGKSSFRPIITGDIRSDPDTNGSLIYMKMNMHLIVIIFMAVWISPVVWAFLYSILVMVIHLLSFIFPIFLQIEGIIQDSIEGAKPAFVMPRTIPDFLIPIISSSVLLFLGYGFAVIPFKLDASKSKAFFLKLF